MEAQQTIKKSKKIHSVVSVRRAHMKECFETLKKNIPNIEEKKTSNLSVLRSALRYIQVSCCSLIFD